MAQEQGVNEIRRELQNVNFPATKQDLMNRMGDRRITAGGKQMNMRDVIQRVDKDRYESQDELVRDIQSNVPELRG